MNLNIAKAQKVGRGDRGKGEERVKRRLALNNEK